MFFGNSQLASVLDGFRNQWFRRTAQKSEIIWIRSSLCASGIDTDTHTHTHNHIWTWLISQHKHDLGLWRDTYSTFHSSHHITNAHKSEEKCRCQHIYDRSNDTHHTKLSKLIGCRSIQSVYNKNIQMPIYDWNEWDYLKCFLMIEIVLADVRRGRRANRIYYWYCLSMSWYWWLFRRKWEFRNFFFFRWHIPFVVDHLIIIIINILFNIMFVMIHDHEYTMKPTDCNRSIALSTFSCLWMHKSMSSFYRFVKPTNVADSENRTSHNHNSIFRQFQISSVWTIGCDY